MYRVFFFSCFSCCVVLLNYNCTGMMPMDDRYVPSGWLHKSARFSLLHPLKMRYFVLLDKELRYYKHPVRVSLHYTHAYAQIPARPN